MKKLFISCPMNGRTEENVKKSMKKCTKSLRYEFYKSCGQDIQWDENLEGMEDV